MSDEMNESPTVRAPVQNSSTSSIENDDDENYDVDVETLLSLLHGKKWLHLPTCNAKNITTANCSDDAEGTKQIQPQQQQLQQLTDNNTGYTVVLKQMIALIQQYPETFIHFMEQSNDKNRNWDTITQLIQQIHRQQHHQQLYRTKNDDDNIKNDLPSTTLTFLSHTILIKKRGWTFLHWLCSHGGTPITVIETLLELFMFQCQITTTTTCVMMLSELIVRPDTYIGDTCLHLLCRNASQFSSRKLQLLLRVLSMNNDNNHDHNNNNNTTDSSTKSTSTNAKKAIVIRNRLGGTILHAATIGAAILDVVQIIVSIHPPVLHIASRDGIYPVTALWYSYSDTIPGYMSIVRILESDTYTTTTNDDNDDAALLYNTATDPSFQRFWEKVEYLAVCHFLLSDSCPQQHSLLCHVGNDTNNERNIHNLDEVQRIYVLHGLLQCNVPINMIKVCLRICPKSATAIDSHGNTPLHALIQNRPYYDRLAVAVSATTMSTKKKHNEFDAIQICVTAYPMAARIINDHQRVPLQLAIINKIPISSGIYDLLLNAAPDTIRYRWLCQQCYSVNTIMDDDDDDTGTNGLYPYQLAAIQNNTSIQSVNTIYYLLLQQPDLINVNRRVLF